MYERWKYALNELHDTNALRYACAMTRTTVKLLGKVLYSIRGSVLLRDAKGGHMLLAENLEALLQSCPYATLAISPWSISSSMFSGQLRGHSWGSLISLKELQLLLTDNSQDVLLVVHRKPLEGNDLESASVGQKLDAALRQPSELGVDLLPIGVGPHSRFRAVSFVKLEKCFHATLGAFASLFWRIVQRVAYE